MPKRAFSEFVNRCFSIETIQNSRWRKASRIMAYVGLWSNFLFLFVTILLHSQYNNITPPLNHTQIWTKTKDDDDDDPYKRTETGKRYVLIDGIFTLANLVLTGILMNATYPETTPRKALRYTQIWLILAITQYIASLIVYALLKELAWSIYDIIDIFPILIVSGYIKQLRDYHRTKTQDSTKL